MGNRFSSRRSYACDFNTPLHTSGNASSTLSTGMSDFNTPLHTRGNAVVRRLSLLHDLISILPFIRGETNTSPDCTEREHFNTPLYTRGNLANICADINTEFQYTHLHEGKRTSSVPIVPRRFQYTPLHEGKRNEKTEERRDSDFNTPLYTRGNLSGLPVNSIWEFQYTPLHEGKQTAIDSAKTRPFQYTPLHEGERRNCGRDGEDPISIRPSIRGETMSFPLISVSFRISFLFMLVFNRNDFERFGKKRDVSPVS